MPPLSREDLEAIERIVDRRIAERQRIGTHSTIHPDVTRKITESKHDLEDRSMAFERLVMEALAANREETASLNRTVAKTLPPTANAATGAEAAAVVGAKASIDAKTNALAANIGSKRTLIANILTALALALWQIYEHFSRAGGP